MLKCVVRVDERGGDAKMLQHAKTARVSEARYRRGRSGVVEGVRHLWRNCVVGVGERYISEYAQCSMPSISPIFS